MTLLKEIQLQTSLKPKFRVNLFILFYFLAWSLALLVRIALEAVNGHLQRRLSFQTHQVSYILFVHTNFSDQIRRTHSEI